MKNPIRARLNHPVVDADGHAIEYGPLFHEHLKAAGGPQLAERFQARLASGGWDRATPEERRRRRMTRPSSWVHPAANTLDRATAIMPRLFRARMDEIGLDFAVIYPTVALGTVRDDDEEMRRATSRALNTMYAELYRDQADRMTPVATIPAHTPQEAIAELEHTVRTLGFKAVMINSNVSRPVPAAPGATWVDTLCIDSPYDYDPVWAKCVELKVAVTSHSPSVGWGSRVATQHYVHNHVGSFAAAGESFARALVLSGVTKRFPSLHFGFLEGGVAWATELYAGLVGHCEKRHPGAIDHYDPRRIDRTQMADLFAEYGQNLVRGRPDPADPELARSPVGWHWADDHWVQNELANLGIERAEDLRPLFERNFYFGCEADDPLAALGFDTRYNPFGARLKAVFSSDIGHWDVPDMSEVLEEAWELVERGLMNEADFREFTFANPARLHAGMNPEFFKGTAVEAEVAAMLEGTR